MPKWIPTIVLVLATLALVPFACIARSRATRSPLPRVHLIQDMDNQSKFDSQQFNPLFADRRAMRKPVSGTVARGQLHEDEVYATGFGPGGYAEELPVELTMDLLRRGQDRYEIHCAPCHGISGRGDGMVARRADALQQGTWVPPSSLHEEPARTRPVGHLYNSITNGIRTMPAYGSQISIEDRWAIVGYILALQRSQDARLEDVPAEMRGRLR